MRNTNRRPLWLWLYDLSAIIPRRWSERYSWYDVKKWFNYCFRHQLWLQQQWIEWGEDSEQWDSKE